MLIDKFKAFLIHILISGLVVASFVFFLYSFWYRGLFEVSQVINPLLLLILVDVVLGPALTFIVYKKNKKTLKFDLSMIVLFQFCAFIYGVYVIYHGKPSWLIFNENAFEVIYEKESGALTGLDNSGFFSSPKFAYIPSKYTRLGVPAHHSLNRVEELEEKSWDIIHNHKIDVAEAVTITKQLESLFLEIIDKDDETLPMFKLLNNGLYHVLIIEQINPIKYTSVSTIY